MRWFRKSTSRITADTQLRVSEYLMNEYRERQASEDPETRREAGVIRKVASDFLMDINKPQAAIGVLKGLRKGLNRSIPEIKDANIRGQALSEVALMEIYLKELGVEPKDFET